MPCAIDLRRRSAAIAFVACLAAAPGGAVGAIKGDPLEKANRKVFVASAALDHFVFGPIARLYRALTPGPIGKGLHNLVVNLSEPVVIANDLVQARPKPAIAAAVRLAVNTTVGLGGVIDVTASKDPHQDNGFGNTLGRWGIGPGPYLFVPFLGPSSVRDLFGFGVDLVSDPLHNVRYPYRTAIGVSRAAVGALDRRQAVEGQMETLLGQATDPYATLRSVYQQQRAGDIAQLKGGEGPPLPALPELDEAPPSPSAAQQPPRLDSLPDGQHGQSDR